MATINEINAATRACINGASPTLIDGLFQARVREHALLLAALAADGHDAATAETVIAISDALTRDEPWEE